MRPQYLSSVLIKSKAAKSFGYERWFGACKSSVEKYHTELAILISTKLKTQGREKHETHASKKTPVNNKFKYYFFFSWVKK